MDKRKRDELISNIEDVRTTIDDVRYTHPVNQDELLEEAADKLERVTDALEGTVADSDRQE